MELKTENGTDRWDVGGQWICRNQKAVMNLLEELGVEIYDQWDTGSKIMQSSDGIIKKIFWLIATILVSSSS